MDYNEVRAEKRLYWSKIIEQWRSSGQSKAVFCREHDFRECRFHYWYRRLRDDSGLSQGGFSRVHAVVGSGIRFRTVTGLELELASDFDEETLKRFLSVLVTLC